MSVAYFKQLCKNYRILFVKNLPLNRANQNLFLSGHFNYIWTCRAIYLKSGCFQIMFANQEFSEKNWLVVVVVVGMVRVIGVEWKTYSILCALRFILINYICLGVTVVVVVFKWYWGRSKKKKCCGVICFIWLN